MTNLDETFTTELQKQFAKRLCSIAQNQKFNKNAGDFLEATYKMLNHIDADMCAKIQEKAREIAHIVIMITGVDGKILSTLESEVLILITDMMFSGNKL